MRPLTAKIVWVGRRQPERPWLAQIVSGNNTETLGSEHETQALALRAANAEIAKRTKGRP